MLQPSILMPVILIFDQWYDEVREEPKSLSF